jgi:DNA-binding PadR family transcriptional regulator
MLTELDNCILGVIWRDGPMSAYDVRSHFAGSTTRAWSSSTGTIYPSIKRLIAGGLIDASERSGPRKRQLLSLTPEGTSALGDWLGRIPAELGSPTADPLRTRVHFLGALPSPKRKQAFDEYRAVTAAKIAQLERIADRPVRTELERSERLGTLGALMEVRARLAWLNAIEADLADLGPNGLS